MKGLANSDPARATELLQQAPQLSYAIFQALLLMGLVSPEAIHSVMEPGSVAPPQAPSLGYPPQPAQGFPQPGAATNTPPVAAPPYNAPGQAATYAAPAPTPAPPVGGQDTEALMRQVMELPLETINMLPEAEKAQILALRAQFGQQRR